MQVLIGMPLNAPDCALLRTRLPPGSGDGSYPGWAMRDVLLGKRWTQSEALAIGMIDEIVPGDQESLLERAVARGADEGRVVASGAYGAIKVGITEACMKCC
jgi:hypothetical protein